MKNPFFSIITPTKNSSRFITNNVDSLVNQTFKDFEQIIIDGNSSDNTLKLITSRGNNKYKCNIFKYPPRGISDAFNKGIKHSKGKYIMILCSDNYLYDKNTLENVYNFLLKNSDYEWIYAKQMEINENGNITGVFPTQKVFQKKNYKLLKILNYIPHETVFMKKEICKRYGVYSIDLKYRMDLDYWLRIGDKTNWGFADVITTCYRYWSEGNSSNKENYPAMNKEMQMILSKYLDKNEMFFNYIMKNATDIYENYEKKINIWIS